MKLCLLLLVIFVLGSYARDSRVSNSTDHQQQPTKRNSKDRVKEFYEICSKKVGSATSNAEKLVCTDGCVLKSILKSGDQTLKYDYRILVNSITERCIYKELYKDDFCTIGKCLFNPKDHLPGIGSTQEYRDYAKVLEKILQILSTGEY